MLSDLDDGTKYFAFVGMVVHVYPLYTHFSKLFYYLVYAGIIVATLSICVLTAVAHYYVKKRSDTKWAMAIFFHLNLAGLSYGCIPTLGTLLTMYRCEHGALFFNENVVCGSYDHILLSVFGGIVILLYLALLSVSSLLYFDTTKASRNYMSMKVTNAFSLELALRVLLTALGVLLPPSESKLWLLSALMFAGYLYLFFDSVVKEEVFHMKLSNFVMLL